MDKNNVIKLAKMNVKELKQYLKENGHKGYSKLKKTELLELVYDVMQTDTATITYNIKEELVKEKEALLSVNTLAKMLNMQERTEEECEIESKKNIKKHLISSKDRLNNILKEQERINKFNADMEKLNSNLRAKQVARIYRDRVLSDTYLVGGNCFIDVGNVSEIIVPAINNEVFPNLELDNNCVYLADDWGEEIIRTINMYQDDMINFNRSINTIKFELLSREDVKKELDSDYECVILDNEENIKYYIDTDKLISYLNNNVNDKEIDIDKIEDIIRELENSINQMV